MTRRKRGHLSEEQMALEISRVDWRMGQLLLLGSGQHRLSEDQFARPVSVSPVVGVQAQDPSLGSALVLESVAGGEIWSSPVEVEPFPPAASESGETSPRAGCGKSASPVR